MTQVHGFTDYIGPSGGLKSEVGNIHIIAGKGFGRANGILVSGTNLYVDVDGFGNDDGYYRNAIRGDYDTWCSGEIFMEAGDGIKLVTHNYSEIHISGQGDMNVYSGSDIALGCIGNFTIGGIDFSKPLTPVSLRMYTLGTLLFRTQDYCDFAAVDPVTGATRTAFIADQDTLWFDTLPGAPVIHNSTSGVVEMDWATRKIGDVQGHYGGVTPFEFETDEGIRPTINGSGIATLTDACCTYWYGRLTADQAVTSSESSMLYDTVSSQGGITHTNGTANVYLEESRRYEIDIVLPASYNIGGHQCTLYLYYYNGSTITAIASLPTPTTPQNRNIASLKYVLSTVVAAGQYVYVRAKHTVAQPGKEYLKDDSFFMIKELNTL